MKCDRLTLKLPEKIESADGTVCAEFLALRGQKIDQNRPLCTVQCTKKLQKIILISHFRPSCSPQLYSSETVHGTSGRYLGSLSVPYAITYIRYRFCRSYQYHLGYAFGTGTITIYGSRGKCQFP